MTYQARADVVSELLEIWGSYSSTSLVEAPSLAQQADVGRVLVKLEGERPLGNFKVLGGMLAGLRALARTSGATSLKELCSDGFPRECLQRLICASDGNHGLAVAAAAQRAGASASIYLPAGVSIHRKTRIQSLGAKIISVAGTYDDAVWVAAKAAGQGDGLLIPDTTSDLANEVVRDVMHGYGVLTGELVAQLAERERSRPSHLFVQAGVGGLAAAMAHGLRNCMQEPRKVLIVEPVAAACVARALSAGRPVRIDGDLSTGAEMLSCGLASAPALEILLRHDARSISVSEFELNMAVRSLESARCARTTVSGAAGLAGLLHVAASPRLREKHLLAPNSVVLIVATEAAISERAQECGPAVRAGESPLLP